MMVKVLNHETLKVLPLKFTEVTAVKWHPRQNNKILIGFRSGNIQLFDLVANKGEVLYKRKVEQGDDDE